MSEQSSKSYRSIASAIVIAGVLISASLFVALDGEVRTMTSTSTITTTMTISGTEFLPANMTLEYLSASGSCFGPGGYEPCWDSGYNVSAYVFNCGSAAATPQGCAQQVISTLIPAAVYTINIRYPFSNQTTQEINQIVPSLVNCLWSVQGDVPLQGYAHCISLTSTSFIMGEQAPPPM